MNTSAGGSEVAIEGLVAAVEMFQAGNWTSVLAECDLDPEAPLLIWDDQAFAFDCTFEDLPPGTDLRIRTAASVFGLDEPVLQVIDIP